MTFAHVSHYIWVVYIPPALIVLYAIGRSVLEQRRARREGNASDEESGGGA